MPLASYEYVKARAADRISKKALRKRFGNFVLFFGQLAAAT